jgi:hypothetical protein
MSTYRRVFAKVDAAIEKYLPLIQVVANKLKNALDSGIVRTLVDLTPADWDNKLREQFVIILDRSFREFTIVAENLKPDGSINFPKLLEQIARLTKVDRDNLYFKISALMLKYLHEGKLKQSEYDLFVQGNYTASIAA